MLEALAACDAISKSTAIDSTYVKSRADGVRWKKGARAQAICPSRGGQTTKACPAKAGIYALTGVVGPPHAVPLAPGNVADVGATPTLLDRAVGAKYIVADKGYDADALRRSSREAGAYRSSLAAADIRYDRKRYTKRHLIENAFLKAERLPAHRGPTTSWQPTSSPPSRSQPSSQLAAIESGA